MNKKFSYLAHVLRFFTSFLFGFEAISNSFLSGVFITSISQEKPYAS